MRDVEAMRRTWKDHWLTAVVGLLAVASFAAFVWGERGYFCDQAKDHHTACGGFWGAEHMHDLVYNATSNWQSELLFGVLLVVLLHRLRGGDA